MKKTAALQLAANYMQQERTKQELLLKVTHAPKEFYVQWTRLVEDYLHVTHHLYLEDISTNLFYMPCMQV